MHPFSYHAPRTLPEAFELLAADLAGSRLLAGGTDLYLALENGLEGVRHLIDLKRIPGLQGIALAPEGACRIGALTLMSDLLRDSHVQKHLPALASAAAVVGGPPIRNRATLGGNLCNASPAADTAPPLVALGAQVEIVGKAGQRIIPLTQLWRGARINTLQPGEVLSTVLVPAQPARSATGFARLTRSAMDIALVNAAGCLRLAEDDTVSGLRLALGAVAPTVLELAGPPALLGQPLNTQTLNLVREYAQEQARPIDDLRASAAYRREMVGVLAVRAVRQAAAQLGVEI